MNKSYPRWFITILLSLCLVLHPTEVRAGPGKDMTLFVCLMVVVGGVLIGGIWYACNKIPKPGSCPCGCGVTNCPCNANEENSNWGPTLPPTNGTTVVVNPSTVGKTKTSTGGLLPLLDIEVTALFTNNGTFADSQNNQYAYQGGYGFALQSSTNLVEWPGLYRITVWNAVSPFGCLVSVTSNDVPIYTAFYTQPQNTNNSLPIDLPPNMGQPKQFFRTMCQ